MMNNTFGEDAKRDGWYSTVTRKLSDLDRFVRNHQSQQHGQVSGWIDLLMPTFDTAYVDSGVGGVQPVAMECRYTINNRIVTLYLGITGYKNNAGTTLLVFPATAIPAAKSPNMQVIGTAQLYGSSLGYIGGVCFNRPFDGKVYAVYWTSIPNNEQLYAASIMIHYEGL